MAWFKRPLTGVLTGNPNSSDGFPITATMFDADKNNIDSKVCQTQAEVHEFCTAWAAVDNLLPFDPATPERFKDKNKS